MAETKTRILVVEDDVIVASDIEKSLEHFGYKVPATASSGEQAISKALDLKPDLILMDIRLKGKMDGVEAAAKIREKLNVPVIYLTAYSDEKTIERAKITEPLAYLLKPFEERELKTAVEIALYRHKIEEKVRALKEFNENIIQSISDGITVVGRDKKITAVNKAMEDLLGAERNELLGKTMYEDYMPELSGILEPLLGRTLNGGRVSNEKNIAYSDARGEDYTLDASMSPLLEGGKITGAVIITRDVSAKRRMKEKIRLLEKKELMLNESDKLVLCGLVLHPELNTIELAKKLRMKRTTLTSVRNKLRKMGFYSTIIVPNLQALGYNALHVEYGEASPVNGEYDRFFKERFESSEYVNAAVGVDEYYGVSLIKDVDSSLESISSGKDAPDLRHIYFNLGNAELCSLFDYGDFLTKYLKVDLHLEAKVRKAQKSKTRKFSKNEAGVLYVLSRNPDLSDKEVAKITSLSTVAVGQIRRRLLKDRAYSRKVIPDLKKLGCDVLALVHGTPNQEYGVGDALKLNPVFCASDSKNVFLLVPFKDLSDYSTAFEETRTFSDLRTGILPLDKVREYKIDFSQIVKDTLDVDRKFLKN